MKILVTGARGYFGGHVVQTLMERGHGIIGVGSRNTTQWYAAMRLRDVHLPDAVVHLAWYASAGDGQPELQQRCLDETRSFVRWLSEQPATNQPKFIFPSTLGVYGGNGLRVSRETDWASPGCAYTRAKATAEWGIAAMLQDRTTILRLGSLMGMGVEGGRTRTDLVVNAFASEGYHTGTVEVWSPEAVKPVVHVRDAAHVVALAVEQDGWEGCWNVHDGGTRTAGQIAGLVCEITGAEVREVGDANGSARRSVIADVAKLRTRMGDYEFRTVESAVLEFAGFQPSTSDRNIPW